MAVTIDGGKPLTIAIAVTCTRVDGLPTNRAGLYLAITSPAAAAAMIIQDGVTVDGAALPANYFRVPQDTTIYHPLHGSHPLLIAGGAAGACTIQLVPGPGRI